MLFSLALLSSLSACADDGELPVLPAGGEPSAPAASTPARIASTVCAVSDLSTRACTTGNVAGLTVTAGGVATTTDAVGRFELTLPAGTTTTDVTVTGANITPTTRPVTLADGAAVIPAIDAQIYQQMLANTGLVFGSNTGALLTTVGVDGAPVSDFNITTNPAAPFGAFFESTTPVNWSTDGNGQRGVAWIPGLTVGSYDLSYDMIAGGLETNVDGVQVRNGGVTILDTSLTSSPSGNL
ncbi:MAG TPA: hypothetical protein VGM90_36645 [Kofleriaceae bacterium]